MTCHSCSAPIFLSSLAAAVLLAGCQYPAGPYTHPPSPAGPPPQAGPTQPGPAPATTPPIQPQAGPAQTPPAPASPAPPQAPPPAAPEQPYQAPVPPQQSTAWNNWVETQVRTGVGGHGPDVGSEEWKVAVSRRLGIFDAQGHGPDLGSDEWRNAVERRITGG